MERTTAAVWRAALRIDKSKLNPKWLAFRNAIGVALPLSIGIALGKPLGGVAVATGALNVAYSDGRDPYGQRARRMLLWSFLGALSVFIGSVTGKYHFAAILFVSLWAFGAGLMLAISTRAGDLGVNTLVALIVFGARGALSPEGAAEAAGLVLAGGLLQTFFALTLWPLHRYEPERRAIGQVFSDLAKEVDPQTDILEKSPLDNPPAQIQDVISAVGRDHSVEGERFRLLFDQADRLRLSIYLVSRLRAEVSEKGDSERDFTVECLDQLLSVSSQLLASVGDSLRAGKGISGQDPLLRKLDELVEAAQKQKSVVGTPLVNEIASAVDALAGQLRLAIRWSAQTTTTGAEEFLKHELASPFRMQLTNGIATLKANLDLRSAACRHAIRLAVCVAIADGIGRGISWQRSYWMPMTVAVILKPDFTTTFSRGFLRLAGTYSGLLIATAAYHLLPPSSITQLMLVGVFTFVMRYLGPANYGVFSVAISGLIVFLIAATGIRPSEVVVERFINTSMGGVFALIAYMLWPTWERRQVGDSIADMLEASRTYFHAVAERFGRDDPTLESELDAQRDKWRRARSNAQASADRVAAEPGVPDKKLDCLTSILASSHALAHSVMALEAGMMQTEPHTSPEAFRTFANDVEFTLYFLEAALRGSKAASKTLPKLRDDYRRMLEARDTFAPADEFVLFETDRLTVSLNTLREAVLRYEGKA